MRGKDRTAITHRFYAFYNWMATSGELDWWTDEFAVFWTDEARCLKAILNFSRRKVIQEMGADTLKGIKGGADVLAKQEAERFVSQFVDERFYTPKMSAVSNDWHDELVISAENLTDYDAVKA
jgi:hypothetical protein